MMKYVRWAVMTVFLALLLALVPAGFAQSNGLSQPELDAWSAANSASSAASSLQFDFKLGFAVEGVSNSLQLTGNGLISKSADNPLLLLAITGTRTVRDLPTPIDFEIRVTNGTLYYRNAASNNGQWRSQNFEEFVAGVQKNSTSFPLDLKGIMQGDFSSFSPILKGFQARMPGLNVHNYIQTARKDNHYGALLDLGGLIGDKEVRNLLVALAQQGQQQQQSNASNGQMDENQMANAAVLVALMLKSSRLTLDEWVTDGKISRAVVTVSLNIDPTQVGAQGKAQKVAARFDLNLSGYDAAYTVDAPAGAVEATVQPGDLLNSDTIAP